jgi:hypothetical protein
VSYTVKPVVSARALRAFIRVPFRLYRDDPNWVAPLLAEEKKKFHPKRNPMLHHCECAHFLLLSGGRPAGRISAFIDRLALEHWKQPIGLFGSYECVEDPNGSTLLLNAAARWLKDRGMKRMRGPWSFASQEWGLVIKGFDMPPMIMAPYNPPYYSRHFDVFGLNKAKDLYVYAVDASKGYVLPGRFLKWTDRIEREQRVKVRPIDMKRLEDEVLTLVRVANESTRNNWGFVPVTQEEAKDMARSLKPIVDGDLVMLAEVEGRAVGYLIVLPDIHELTKTMHGRLLPFGWLRLLRGLARISQYRVWALGVVPEYQRRAIDTLFYRKLHEALMPKKPGRVEINYVLEDNMAMNNPILKMGFKHVKTYRVYEMGIA